MAAPTPQQLATAITNLKRMQAMNDHAYPQNLARISDAFDLLTEPDDSSNAGLTIVLNLVEGAFWAIGSSVPKAYTAIGNFAASFFSGMVAWWGAGSAPPELNGQFVSLRDCYTAAYNALDSQLAGYSQSLQSTDPAVVQACWDTSFTYNEKTTAISDLGTEELPVESDDPDFVTMVTASVTAFAQGLWTTLLDANAWITLWLTAPQEKISGNDPNSPPLSTIQAYIKSNPAYYYTWEWHAKKGKCDSSGWLITEYSLGKKIASEYHDNAFGPDVCAYLFADSTDGVPLNPGGLFPRKTVFTALKIRQLGYAPTYSTPAAMSVSPAYLEADQQGNTLPALVEREGRDATEQRITQQAQEDPVFAHNLVARPRQTLEAFLGVKIPETVSLAPIIENPQRFGLVIPMADNYLPPAD
ncbi:MAG TPA: hypothetical protein VNP98_06200 [Chthoniobacterales bacterium]|nr:hypothetical protein [Chthoniobacterales bacterium]